MQEFNYYHAELSKGMVGPLNYYRTTKFRHDDELGKFMVFLFITSSINIIYKCCINVGLSADLRSDLPFLLIWGTKDPTAIPFAITSSRKYISRYQDIALEGRGHWLMVEAKDDITESVVKWLEGLTSNRRFERL